MPVESRGGSLRSPVVSRGYEKIYNVGKRRRKKKEKKKKKKKISLYPHCVVTFRSILSVAYSHDCIRIYHQTQALLGQNVDEIDTLEEVLSDLALKVS